MPNDKIIVGIIIAVAIILAGGLMWYLWPTAPGLVQPSVASSSPVVSPPASDSVIKFAPPIDNTNINTGSATPSIDGSATVPIPVSTPAPTTTPIPTEPPCSSLPASGSLQRIIIWYPATNFGGSATTLSTGGMATLAHYTAGKYVFDIGSMKVEPGTKLVFSRKIPGGIAKLSFASGKCNISDMEKWFREYDKMAGVGNWGYGAVELDAQNLGTNPIYLQVVDEAKWATLIRGENAACRAFINLQHVTAGCSPLTIGELGKDYPAVQ